MNKQDKKEIMNLIKYKKILGGRTMSRLSAEYYELQGIEKTITTLQLLWLETFEQLPKDEQMIYTATHRDKESECGEDDNIK